MRFEGEEAVVCDLCNITRMGIVNTVGLVGNASNARGTSDSGAGTGMAGRELVIGSVSGSGSIVRRTVGESKSVRLRFTSCSGKS